MDILSSSLLSLKVNATVLSRWHLKAPWGISVDNFQPGYCLFLQEGFLYLDSEEFRSERIEPGQLVFSPFGADCSLRSEPSLPCVDIQKLPWTGPRIETLTRLSQPEHPLELKIEGAGPSTRVLGFAFSIDSGSSSVLFKHIPELCIFDKPSSIIARSLESLFMELSKNHEPGYFAAMHRLVEFSVTAMLREQFLIRGEDAQGWAGAIKNKKMFDLISAIHSQPEAYWTLKNMSEAVLMSRTSFCRTFHDILGLSPIKYVTDVRLNRVADQLSISEASIEEIAYTSGFRSARALRKAFSNKFGLSPSQYRRKATRPSNATK